MSCLCLCPVRTPCWYKSCALPRQPVVFYDETRYDLERDLKRGEKRNGFFPRPWHPRRGTTTSDFHFRRKTQGSLSYGHDSECCFTARDAPCLSISPLSLMSLSQPVWRVKLSACGSLRPCAYLSVLMRGSLTFSLSPCYFVPRPLLLSEVEEAQCNSLCLLPSTCRPNNGCDARRPWHNATRSDERSICCCFEQPLSLCVPTRVWTEGTLLCTGDLALHLQCH